MGLLSQTNLSNGIFLQEIEMVEQDFINEKKSAVREFEVQKIYLRDQASFSSFDFDSSLH
jgi:hypothetical protein